MNTVSFICVAYYCYYNASFTVDPKNGRPAAMISKEIYEIVRDNAEALDSVIIYNRDFNYNL
jgi:hypothetical protein